MTVSRTALARLYQLSRELPPAYDDQARDRAFAIMKEEIRNRIQVSKKHSVELMYMELDKNGVGTNEVEMLARKVLDNTDNIRSKAHVKEVRRLIQIWLKNTKKQKLTLLQKLKKVTLTRISILKGQHRVNRLFNKTKCNQPAIENWNMTDNLRETKSNILLINMEINQQTVQY